MENSRLQRINELARKSKVQELSEEEKIEQKKLREEYIEEFRQGFHNVAQSIIIQDEDGNQRRLQPKKKK